MRKTLFTSFHLKIRSLFICRGKELGILNVNVQKVSFDDFVLTFVCVTSRTFHVDSFHPDSMVSFADLFYYRTDGNHVNVERTSTSSSDTDVYDDYDNDVEIVYVNEELENEEDMEKQNGAG